LKPFPADWAAAFPVPPPRAAENIAQPPAISGAATVTLFEAGLCEDSSTGISSSAARIMSATQQERRIMESTSLDYSTD
jgi:hypothetical protein